MKTLIRALALSVLAIAFTGAANATGISVLTTFLTNGSLTYNSSGGLCSGVSQLDGFTTSCEGTGPSSSGWYGYGSVDYDNNLPVEPDVYQNYHWSLTYDLSYEYGNLTGGDTGSIDLGPYSEGSLNGWFGITSLSDVSSFLAALDNPLYEPGIGAVFVPSSSTLDAGTVLFALDFQVDGNYPPGFFNGIVPPDWDWSNMSFEEVPFGGTLVLTAVPVPEPASLSLLGLGLVALGAMRRRKIKA